MSAPFRTLLPQHEQPAASKEALALFGKQSPHGLAAEHDAQIGVRVEPTLHGPVAAALPGGRRRPTTSMSLRERAYLKSSRGQQQPTAAERSQLPKLKPIPRLDLSRAVVAPEQQQRTVLEYGNKGSLKGPPKLGKGRVAQMAAGLPPRPSSVLGTARSGAAARKDALQVPRPFSVASAAGRPREVAFAHGVDMLPDPEYHSITSAQTTHSRASSALGPLRLNTAELIRQNEILKQENEELRRIAYEEAGGGREFSGSWGGAASRRSESPSVLSNRSTLSSAWRSTHRSRKPSTSGSNAMLTVRSDVSTAESIKFIQGKEHPAETRIKELEAEILKHRQREEDMQAALLLSAADLPIARPDSVQDVRNEQISQVDHRPFPTKEDEAPTIQIDLQACSTRRESPPVRSSLSKPTTSHSAKLSRLLSVPRTAGNLTPYPRGSTASSNAAVIGAQRGMTQDGLNGSKPSDSQQQATMSSTGAHPVTSSGPYSIVMKHHSDTEWVAQGLKIDPLNSTVEMSQSARLTYPAKRLLTLAHGGGGSWAYSAAGRGPILINHAARVPDGLMVRSPPRHTQPRPIGGSACGQGEQPQGDVTDFNGGEQLQKSKVMRGDKEANSWHATLASSAMRWDARTRKFA